MSSVCMQVHTQVQVCLMVWRQRTMLGVIPWVDIVTDFVDRIPQWHEIQPVFSLIP